MAQTGFTPIQLYSTSTAAAAPVAGNLTNSTLGSELAINITDGKLFYKDNANAVQVIGWKTVPTTAGGTGLTTYTAGDLSYYATGTTFTKLAIGTTGQILTSTGSAPQWSTLSGVAVTTFSAGTTGFTPNSATSGAVTLAGTLATTNGGTGLTAFTANGVFYASSTSAIAQSASLTFSGTTLTAGNYSTGGNLTFTGTGNRITGDFSNGTQANRVAFQTSTANSSTVLTVIPNGTGANSQINLFNNSDPANASTLTLVSLGATETSVRSNITGTGTYLPLTMYTGGAEALRITTNRVVTVGYSSPTTTSASDFVVAGNGGFGTSAPNHKLTVWTGGTLPSAIANTQLLVGDTTGFANAGIAIVTNAGNASSLTFGSTASPTLGRIEYDNTNNFMRFYTNSAEQLRITSAGNINVVTGNVIIATSGKGIDFSATAGTGTSELLADYEEGTFTATLTAATPPTTPPTVTGHYTKTGRCVTVICDFSNVNTTGASGDYSITGLPFTSANNGANSCGAMQTFQFANEAATAFLPPNSATITLASAYQASLSTTAAGAGKYVRATITYFAA